MATADASADATPAGDQLEGQTYEIIRNRLVQQGDALRNRLATLNASRKEVFGSIETELLGTDRITTENNCVSRDMIAIGDQFLFGYNVHLGLRTETKLEDVFSVYTYRDRQFQPGDLALNLLLAHGAVADGGVDQRARIGLHGRIGGRSDVMCDVARQLEVERFLHISTDEVYGSIEDGSFSETDPLVRQWYRLACATG